MSSDSVFEPAHSSSETSRPIERPSACAYERGWGESEDAAAGECPFCFCSPCVTFHRQSWLGSGQPAHGRNSAIRKTKYKKYWSMMERRNAWRHPRYLRKKSAAMQRDDVDETVVQISREIMPDCVLTVVRDLYPNPPGQPYMGHRWW